MRQGASNIPVKASLEQLLNTCYSETRFLYDRHVTE